MQFISEQTVNEMKLGMTTKLPVDGEDVCDAILFQFKWLHSIVNITQVQVLNHVSHLCLNSCK